MMNKKAGFSAVLKVAKPKMEEDYAESEPLGHFELPETEELKSWEVGMEYEFTVKCELCGINENYGSDKTMYRFDVLEATPVGKTETETEEPKKEEDNTNE